jgi:hypothetical protein
MIRSVPNDSFKFGIAHFDLAAWKFATVLRHGEQHLCKGRRLRPFQALQALVLHHIHHDDSRFTVLGDGLRCAPRRLDDFAEAVLGVL